MDKDYDQFYEILRLPKGSSPDQIQANWRLYAALMAPTNFAGQLKEKAEQEQKQVNIARDELLSWWQKNNTAPPTRQAGAYQKPSAAPAPGPSPSADPEAQPAPQSGFKADFKPRNPPKPFGPTPRQKGPLYQIYELMLSKHPEAQSWLIIPWLGYYFGPPLVGMFITMQVLPRQNPDTMLIIAFVVGILLSIPFWFIANADMDIYKVLSNPFLASSPLSAQEAMNKISGLIDGKDFAGYSWQLAHSDLSPDDKILAKDWVLVIDNKYKLKLSVRVLENSPISCAISYWFDLAGPDWKLPVAKLLKSTDTALSQGLK